MYGHKDEVGGKLVVDFKVGISMDGGYKEIGGIGRRERGLVAFKTRSLEEVERRDGVGERMRVRQ